jgi:hypothetical protein
MASGFSLVLGGLAQAQVSNSLIYACVKNDDGTVHIVASNAACRRDETPLVWNAVGPQGPAGPAGPAGPQGPIGATGQKGPAERLGHLERLGCRDRRAFLDRSGRPDRRGLSPLLNMRVSPASRLPRT